MAERAKVLVTDGGARGAVLVEAYAKSEHVGEIFAVPGNSLMYINARGKPVHEVSGLKTTSVDDIAAVCEMRGINLVDVAQDNAVEAGLTNKLLELGIPVIGPTREAGRIEWDKEWARGIAKRAGVPQPESFAFADIESGVEFIKSRPDSSYFVKATGLDAGKGALGAKDSQEAIDNIKKLKGHGKAAETYLIEEYLQGDSESNFEPGEEFSCFLLVNGGDYKLIGYAQDHKRGENFNKGDMTGGMGSYNKPACITEELNQEILSTIADPLIRQMKEEGVNYSGVMYLGGMLVKRKGELKPYLIEVNARWGDPEAQVIVPGIKNDLFEVSMNVFENGVKDLNLEIDDAYRVAVVGASRGYPGDYSAVNGMQVFGIQDVLDLKSVRLYPAGLFEHPQTGEITARGGRLFSVVGESQNSKVEAASKAYGALALVSIEGNNLQARIDIAHRDRERGRQSQLRKFKSEITYATSGVDYGPMDHLKRMASEFARTTEDVAKFFGFEVIPESRGESAFLVRTASFISAFVQEGLGTKALIMADMPEVYPEGYLDRIADRTDFDWSKPEVPFEALAWDTVGCIVNDLTAVGAQPAVLCPHWAVGDSNWFTKERSRALWLGWLKACSIVGAVYGPGETSTLAGVVNPSTIELSGSGFGVIMPPQLETLGAEISPGDHIILVESNGIHANGVTLARKIAKEFLLKGLNEKLPSGRSFGEALLSPTHLYAPLQRALLIEGANIKYMMNITGHGWSKIMRAQKPFTYYMHTIPTPQEEFTFMQKAANISDFEMYKTFNNGAGYGMIVPADNAAGVIETSKKLGLQAWDAGTVEKGPKQVIIEPKNIVYSAETLNIR